MDAPPALPPGCAARYVVTRRLGEGGQGVVYLATQVALDRAVALKLLTAHDADFQARFRQEAQVAGRLAHPNLVAVLDHDVEDGQGWIAYEYVPGETLRQRIARSRMHWTEAVLTCAAIARGLAAVHAIGAVHRDVKPENVLLGAGEPKLTDFGLVRWDQGTVGTQPGVLMGTPAYMAPEVVQGERAGPAADVYALGAILFELIAGRAPFEADQPLISLRLQLEPVAPEALAALASPRAVRELIGQCLAKDQNKRPASAAALAEQLAAAAARGAPEVAATRAQKSLRRGPAPAKSQPTLVRAAGVARGRGLSALRAAGIGIAGCGVVLAIALWGRGRVPAPTPSVAAPGSASVAPEVALGPLDARADRLAEALEATAVGLRKWEVAVPASMGQDVPNAEARRRLEEFARHRAAVDAFARELAALGATGSASHGVDRIRARVAAMRFEIWFWEGWGAQYIRDPHVFSPTDGLLAEPGKRALGGGRLWAELARLLDGVLRSASLAPETFDARAADALFQMARALRYLRTRKDAHVFAERDLPGTIDRWLAALDDLPGPMHGDLAAVTRVLKDSAIASGDPKKVLPKVREIAASACESWLAAKPGWDRVVQRLAAVPNP